VSHQPNDLEVRLTRDERLAPQARQEEMQPTGQMNASEMPQNEGKPVDQDTEQSQEKGDRLQGSSAGPGPPGKHAVWVGYCR